MPDQVMLLAENMPIMHGQYGVHQGNAAVKIESIVEIYDPENSGIKNATVVNKKPLSDPKKERV